MKRIRIKVLALATIALSLSFTRAAEPKPASQAGCAAAVPAGDFQSEVWAKIGARFCLTCHTQGGDAEESAFLLLDPGKLTGKARDDAFAANREAFLTMAKRKDKDTNQSRILLKVSGKLGHGGKDVLPADSAGYRVLADFVRRADGGKATELPAANPNEPPFFEGVTMIDDRRLLRRLTLSLAGRLPTQAELSLVAKGGTKAIPGILDAVMKEDTFYTRLREGFNDVFLTEGLTGSTEADVLSYEHFNTTRLWTQKHDLSAVGDAKAQQQARYKITNDYRKVLLGEPMKLVEFIVRNDRPFTEIVTADYTMVSPYTARGYGIFEQVKDQFKNPDDPFEYIPVRLKALVGRTKDGNQDSATGFYPHAGLLSAFQYIVRYPTTETNRNRLRSRMYYQHFLGVDVLELAARVSDAAAAQSKYKVPTMEAAECVVCHRTLDPVAGLFQDYWRFADMGVYGKRKGGWFTDMFGPGFEGEDLPGKERWRSLQWLGERTSKDPRFAVAMVEHVWYILSGRKVLLPPKDIDDPLFNARSRAYRTQRCEIEAVAGRFAAGGFNLKNVFKELALSEFYRADGLATAAKDPKRRAELDDLGLVRMLAPEQMERNIAAIFGERWGKLNDQVAILYGGIDSKEVTERATDPSGAMGAIQRILSNDVACKQVAKDFARPTGERVLFPKIEPNLVPGIVENDAAIREAIVFLHQRVLGRNDAVDSAEVTRTFNLFSAVVKDAAGQKVSRQEIYSCKAEGKVSDDAAYTIRAWRAVVTYLLRRQEFLYE